MQEQFSSPLIIKSSSLVLIQHSITVIFCYPRLSMSLSNRLTSSAQVSRFLSDPFLAALMIEFSMPTAFSGLTVLIFITRWFECYIFPWPRGLGFGLEWPAFALRLALIMQKVTVFVPIQLLFFRMRFELAPLLFDL